jgi:hypothetical protein
VFFDISCFLLAFWCVLSPDMCYMVGVICLLWKKCVFPVIMVLLSVIIVDWVGLQFNICVFWHFLLSLIFLLCVIPLYVFYGWYYLFTIIKNVFLLSLRCYCLLSLLIGSDCWLIYVFLTFLAFSVLFAVCYSLLCLIWLVLLVYCDKNVFLLS